MHTTVNRSSSNVTRQFCNEAGGRCRLVLTFRYQFLGLFLRWLWDQSRDTLIEIRGGDIANYYQTFRPVIKIEELQDENCIICNHLDPILSRFIFKTDAK